MNWQRLPVLQFNCMFDGIYQTQVSVPHGLKFLQHVQYGLAKWLKILHILHCGLFSNSVVTDELSPLPAIDYNRENCINELPALLGDFSVSASVKVSSITMKACLFAPRDFPSAYSLGLLSLHPSNSYVMSQLT